MTRRKSRRAALDALGVRSGLEDNMKKELEARGIKYTYEEVILDYFLKEKGICMDCEGHNIYSSHKYTPDFYLPDYNIYIETKGRFLGKDRTKHRAIQEFHPDADIRFVFYREGWLTKDKKTSYTGWCEGKKIPYFIRVPGTTKREEVLLPDDWF